jgi:hypothetical protein
LEGADRNKDLGKTFIIHEDPAIVWGEMEGADWNKDL